MSILKTASLLLAAAILTLTVDAFASAADAARNLGYSASPGFPYGDVSAAQSYLGKRQPPVRIYKPVKRAPKARR